MNEDAIHARQAKLLGRIDNVVDMWPEPAARQWSDPMAERLSEMGLDLAPLMIEHEVAAIKDMATMNALASVSDFFWQSVRAGKSAEEVLETLKEAVGLGPIRPTFPGDAA